VSPSLDHLHAKSIFDPRDDDFAGAPYPFIQLTDPGMPAAGVDFVALASALGDDVSVEALKNKKEVVTGQILSNLYRQALYDPHFNMRVSFKNNVDGLIVRFLPGHIWGPRHGADSDEEPPATREAPGSLGSAGMLPQLGANSSPKSLDNSTD
jgi:hypothetical protein